MLITKLPLGFLGVKCDNLRKTVIHFPLAGYFSFLFWYATYKLSSFIFNDSFVAVCISLAVVYFFFNLFHFDGFLDSIDGLLSQKPKEDVLRIMKLGNIGPTALFFGLIYLILKVYLAGKIDITAFLPVFVISRWGMSFSAWLSKPATETGLGNMIAFGKPGYLACSALYLPALILISSTYIICIMIGATILIDILLVKLIEHRIGGLTGDNFGLINELNELLLMMTAFILA